MSGKFQIERGHSNIGLFSLVVGVQVGLLALFAGQTWFFVNILYPDDLLVMRALTVFSVDGMALVWACLIWFYSFAHPHSKNAARTGKWVDYGLSAIISVIYMVMTYTFRYYHITDLTAVQVGSVCSIIALIFNVILVFVFLDKEIGTRWPAEDEFVIVDKKKTTVQPPSQSIDTSPQTDQFTAIPTTPQAAIPTGTKAAKNGHAASNGA